MWTSRSVVVAWAMAVAALAQETKKPPDARAFVPPAPTSEAWVDFKAMRDAGLWDAISASAGSSLVAVANQLLGFSLSRVDRLRGYGQDEKSEDGTSRASIVIFESSDELDAPSSPENGDPRIERIAGHDVTIAPSWGDPSDPSVWVAPKKGVLVYGPRHLVAPVLEGTQTPGVTPPELLSLAAGRGVLAHLVAALDVGSIAFMLGELEAPATMVAPAFVMLRVRIDPQPANADEEPHVHLEVRLRWADVGDAPSQFAELLRTRLAALKKHRRFGAFKKIWNLFDIGTDARDVTIHLGLGTPREAGGFVGIAAPMLLLVGVTAEAQAVPLAAPPMPVPVPAPATDPVPAGGGAPEPGNGRGGN